MSQESSIYADENVAKLPDILTYDIFISSLFSCNNYRVGSFIFINDTLGKEIGH